MDRFIRYLKYGQTAKIIGACWLGLLVVDLITYKTITSSMISGTVIMSIFLYGGFRIYTKNNG